MRSQCVCRLRTVPLRLLIDRLKKGPASGSCFRRSRIHLPISTFPPRSCATRQPRFRPFVIHADEFEEHGAGAIEVVGFALSEAVDFVAEMRDRGLDPDRIAGSLSFSFATGSEFFVQIAKLRAFRMAWAKAIESFGGMRAAGKAPIHARTAQWNRTIYDPHVNILRATTEVISAILGGADSVSCAPFDECYKQPDETSRRLARNTQIVLKRETLLSRVADPLGGSYMVEALTNSIASKAWKLFQELEIAGGYRKGTDDGRDCVGARSARRLATRGCGLPPARCLLGLIALRMHLDRALDRIDVVRHGLRAAGSDKNLRHSACARSSSSYQHRQTAADRAGGNRRCQDAQRALAICSRLPCLRRASTTRIQRFERAEHIADSEADLIVLCSSDAEYLPIAEELMPILKAATIHANVIIAGNPDMCRAAPQPRGRRFHSPSQQCRRGSRESSTVDRNQGLDMRPDFSKIDYSPCGDTSNPQRLRQGMALARAHCDQAVVHARRSCGARTS